MIRALRLFQLNLLNLCYSSIISITSQSLTEIFRKINENLQKHLENLDALEKSKLPSNLVTKCKDFSKLLLETTAKVDKVLNKLDK